MCCWNAGIYFLLLLTQVDFFVSTFYFLESIKNLKNYFYFLQSRILGNYLYFQQSNKVIYFWQHCHPV